MSPLPLTPGSSGTLNSPSVVSRLWDIMVRQDRGFDPILWIFSVADYLKKNDEMSSLYHSDRGVFALAFILVKRIENPAFLLVRKKKYWSWSTQHGAVFSAVAKMWIIKHTKYVYDRKVSSIVLRLCFLTHHQKLRVQCNLVHARDGIFLRKGFFAC